MDTETETFKTEHAAETLKSEDVAETPAPAPAPAPEPIKKPTRTRRAPPRPIDSNPTLMYDVLNSDERSSLTVAKVSESCTELINVDYPGIVVNNDRAVRTMGGILNLSDTLCNPRKKLEVRYRPGDVYCNPVLGEGNITCGLLIRIRKPKKHHHKNKKIPNPKLVHPQSNLIDLESEHPGLHEPIPLTPEERYNLFENPQFHGLNIHSNDAAIVQTKYTQQNQGIFDLHTPNGDFLQTDTVLAEEEKLLEDHMREKIRKNLVVPNTPIQPNLTWQHNRMDSDSDRILIQVPQKSPPTSGWDIEVLGIIPRIYRFNGLVDFQYLPMATDKETGKNVSIYNQLLPLFGDAEGSSGLYAASDLFAKAQNGEALDFVVPPFMSRVDKPIVNSARVLENSSVREKITAVISKRSKRIVYSHLCNFRESDDIVSRITSRKSLIPIDPIPEALAAVKKRLIPDEYLTTFKKLFEERPIWTRQAIEFKLNCDKYITKYLLPCVAYFSYNGPWRSCWIKLGLDPRMSRENFIYQLIDYRFPSNYRMHIPRVLPGDESLFSCRQDLIPPKAQMFYQICELHIHEVEELISATMKRIQDEELCAGEYDYTPKHGFLKEEHLEYCRYAITRNLELYLFRKNLISTVTLDIVPLLPGGVVPKHSFKSATVRNPTVSFRSRTQRPPLTQGRRPVIDDDEESNLAAEFRIPLESLEDEEIDEDRVLDEVFSSDDEDDEDAEEEHEDEEMEILEGEEVFTPEEILKEMGKKH